MPLIANVVCPYCRHLTPAANVEHVIPRARLHYLGQVDAAFLDANTTRTCVACNGAKADLLPHDLKWHSHHRRRSITKQVAAHVSRLIIRWQHLAWSRLIPTERWDIYVTALAGRNRRRSLMHAMMEKARAPTPPE